MPVNRCGTCKHCHYVRFKEFLLCFYGDEISAKRDGPSTWDRSDVELAGEDVCFMDGDEWDRVWARCSVDQGDTCDEWELRAGLESDGTVSPVNRFNAEEGGAS